MNLFESLSGSVHRHLLAILAAVTVLFLPFPLSAQTQVSYIYDAGGNRIARIAGIPDRGIQARSLVKGDGIIETEEEEPLLEETLALDTEPSVSDLSDYSDIKVYPNPFGGDILVDFPDGLGDRSRVSVYTISGTPVYDGYADAPHAELPLAFLKPGIYILVVTSGDMRFSFRIIKE